MFQIEWRVLLHEASPGDPRRSPLSSSRSELGAVVGRDSESLAYEVFSSRLPQDVRLPGLDVLGAS